MRLLILSPHPDDAELGAGATIKKYQNNEIRWMVFSDCVDSLPEGSDNNRLIHEFKAVCHLAKINDCDLISFPVRRFSEYRQDILELLIKERDKFKPDLIIGPSLNDTHQDHTVIAHEMVRAFKNASILSYELPWNNLISRGNYFEKITFEQLSFKLKILSKYQSQVEKHRPYFDPDYIRSLAITRGSQINTNYAEAFELIRWIN